MASSYNPAFVTLQRKEASPRPRRALAAGLANGIAYLNFHIELRPAARSAASRGRPCRSRRRMTLLGLGLAAWPAATRQRLIQG